MRLIVERRVAIKELWEVSDPYEPTTPLHLQGQCRSREYVHLEPLTVRPYVEGEPLAPQANTERARERALRGYWSRLMKMTRTRGQ